ncbi:Fe-S cluster assembly protein SufD [Iodidimonas sp. SYSU 1G8]|uniref:Fe-S cluster assembly protein SufD n=1 Tax=Iodidimonas sp. SYSU 1G8 TaxID=3133967 RepID=UPI0031FE7308
MTVQPVPYADQFARLKPALPGAAALRERAFADYAAHGFPGMKREAWRHTRLSGISTAGFEPAGLTDLTPADIAAHLIPDALTLVFVNGRIDTALSNVEQAPPGVTIESLAKVLARGDELSERLAQAAGATPDDALVSLNTALMHDGAVIRIAEGVTVEAPIHLLFFSKQTGMAQVRNVIVAGAGSRATLAEGYFGGKDTYWTNVVNQFFLEPGAQIDHVREQSEGAAAYHIASNHVQLAANARFDSATIMLGGLIARNETRVNVLGEGADCRLAGVSLGRGKQLHDNVTILDHAVPNSTSDQMFKAVLDDQAHAVYQGKVIVRPDAQKTDARQANHNILLARTAEASSKPELEIFADDVKCAHGATVGELDKDMLFYMQARGLDERTARALLVEGFVVEVLERIGSTEIRDMVSTGVGGWLHGRHLS